jgi:diacylglycerol kinase family enzyme
LKTGLILNPASGRIRKRLRTVRLLAADLPGATVRETDGTQQMRDCVDQFLRDGVDLLVVAGGDGSLQALLNHLLSRPPPSRFPVLAVIPGGTTNMTAADLQIRGGPEKNLKRLANILHQPGAVRLIQRPVLCIGQGNKPLIHGMFFGAGIVASGVRFFQARVKKSGITGENAAAIAVIYMLAGLLFKRRTDALLPVHIRIKDDVEARDQACLVLFASTLDRLLLGTQPYWGSEQGPIHTTCVSGSPKNFWRSLLAMITGHGSGLARADGYYSRNNSSLELMMDNDFIVDGEIFRSRSADGPLRISAGRNINFLSLRHDVPGHPA